MTNGPVEFSDTGDVYQNGSRLGHAGEFHRTQDGSVWHNGNYIGSTSGTQGSSTSVDGGGPILAWLILAAFTLAPVYWFVIEPIKSWMEQRSVRVEPSVDVLNSAIEDFADSWDKWTIKEQKCTRIEREALGGWSCSGTIQQYPAFAKNRRKIDRPYSALFIYGRDKDDKPLLRLAQETSSFKIASLPKPKNPLYE